MSRRLTRLAERLNKRTHLRAPIGPEARPPIGPQGELWIVGPALEEIELVDQKVVDNGPDKP